MNKKNKILDRIDSPKDLSKLNKKEISLLCQEIRELIIAHIVIHTVSV